MKRRYRYLLNLLSLALLVFALYLNFIKKDAAEASSPEPTNNAASHSSSPAKEASVADVHTKTVALK